MRRRQAQRLAVAVAVVLAALADDGPGAVPLSRLRDRPRAAVAGDRRRRAHHRERAVPAAAHATEGLVAEASSQQTAAAHHLPQQTPAEGVAAPAPLTRRAAPTGEERVIKGVAAAEGVAAEHREAAPRYVRGASTLP